MKKHLPVVVLLLFIGAEAFLKPEFSGNRFLFQSSLAVFLVCLAYFVYYFKKQPIYETFTAPSTSLKWNVLIISAILFAGCFLRFWRLGALFEGMAWDEAYEGLDAIAIREFGERPVFLNWNAGREALIAYLVAGSQLLFDYSPTSVRAVLALAGCLTLLFFCLFLRTIFNNNVALFSTFLLAVSKWHIIHTRYAVRVGLIVLFETATLYFLAKGMASARNKFRTFILLGVITGLGFYTYIAYRIFPIVLIAFLLDKNMRSRIRENMKPMAAGFAAALIVFAPLGKFYWENKESFTDRMERTVVWKTRGTELSPLELVLDSAKNTLGMFTFKGDSISRHNVEAEPMLSPFSTALFVLGLLIAVLNIRKPYMLFLLLYFVFTILPGILSVNSPHSSRTLGSVAPAMVLTSLGALAALRILMNSGRTLGTAFLAIVFSGNLYAGPNDALLRYSDSLDSLSPRIAALWGMDRDQYNVSQLLNVLGTNCEAYLPPQFYFHATVEYLTYSKSKHRLLTAGTRFENSLKANQVVVVFLQPHETNLWWLRDDDGKNFFKWWKQTHGMDVKKIRSMITKTYISYPKMTRMSDGKLLMSLKANYPGGKEVDLGYFSAYVIGRQSGVRGE